MLAILVAESYVDVLLHLFNLLSAFVKKKSAASKLPRGDDPLLDLKLWSNHLCMNDLLN